jgi:hypothetical protein
MLDRREALTDISGDLRHAAAALQALSLPDDAHLPSGMRHLLDAIDHVDVAAAAQIDPRAAR